MERPDEGPEWADDAHLDEVFSTWVPGPPDSAPAAEREMAGENPPAEPPADEAVSDEDLEAALAAALAEAEGARPEDNPPAATPAPPRAARSEPRSPSWIDFPSAEDPPAPAPEPTVPARPAMAPDPVAEPVDDFDSQADDRSFDPAPPPPEPPSGPARPWTRSDDDILPGRRGKGRRR